MTANDFNGGAGQVQTFGQEFYAHAVGSVIDRRGLNRNLEGIPVKTDDPVSGRSGLNINFDDDAPRRFLKKVRF